MKDSALDRLLHAASETRSERPNEMPFGFDTRVVAGWRARGKGEFVDLARFLRRVVFLSLAVIAVAGAGVYNELQQSEDPFDQFAIADNAISQAVEP